MACDPQAIFDDNPCLATLPDLFLEVLIAASWCGINGNVAPSGPENQWWNPDQNVGWSNPDVGNAPIVNPTP